MSMHIHPAGLPISLVTTAASLAQSTRQLQSSYSRACSSWSCSRHLAVVSETPYGSSRNEPQYLNQPSDWPCSVAEPCCFRTKLRLCDTVYGRAWNRPRSRGIPAAPRLRSCAKTSRDRGMAVAALVSASAAL